MPLTTDPARANFTIRGEDYEPTDVAWRLAGPAERRAYYRRLGELGKQAKEWELIRGIDVQGKPFVRVKPESRPDGADGKPLSPHYADSRFRRLFDFAETDRSVTFFWRAGWAKYVKYHAYRMGPRALPVRDTVGFSPGRQRWLREGGRLWWANGHRLIVPGSGRFLA